MRYVNHQVERGFQNIQEKRQTNGWMNEQTNGWMNIQTNGWKDRQAYRQTDG
jgi:hypothetical protein